MLLEGKKVFVGPFLRRSERSSDSETKYTNVFVKNLDEGECWLSLHLRACLAACCCVAAGRGRGGGQRLWGTDGRDESLAAHVCVARTQRV